MTEGRFMVAVGAIIENLNTGKILLLKRSERADYAPALWEIPSGRMKQFEDMEEALRRELFEELGLQSFQIVKPLTVRHFYRGEKTADKEIVLIIYWVQTEVEDIQISHEHDDTLWATPYEAISIIDHPAIIQHIEAFLKEREKEGG